MVNKGIATHRLNDVGWGLFFLWVGIALLADLSWGIGLLGVGVLTLGGQIARACMGSKFEKFWVVVGTLFVVGGVWELFSFRGSLIGILCLVAGVLLLIAASAGEPRAEEGQQNAR